VPADQAAGLRRRRAQQPPCCIHAFFDSAESTRRLAQALHQRGLTSLLADARGRVFADSPTRSLFDWRQQIARGQLHTLPQSYGDGWHAPGVRADEPALITFAQDYDCLLFDASLNAPDWTPLPGAAQILIIEANATHASVLQGYALLKPCPTWEAASALACWGTPPPATSCWRRASSFSSQRLPRSSTASHMRMMHLPRLPLEWQTRRRA